MKLRLILSFVAVLVAPWVWPVPALARPPLLAALPCASYPGRLVVCSGQVPSFDGVLLDVDLTKPMQHTGTTHPLMVMLHGFGNNKHEWESTTDEGDNADKWHWNSHWFAEHGYYVLTYTARGFRDDGPTRPDEPATPSGTSASLPNGTIRVKSREVEIRDSQWLAALAAAAFPDLDPHRIAVTGGSYGGGESWLQAAQPDWTFPQSVDPTLPILHLQVAIPKYPWTDLAYSLAPNGHGGGPSGTDLYESSQGQQDTSGVGNPFGVAKASQITGLYLVAAGRGILEEGTATSPPTTEGPTPFTAWLARIAAGEPYDIGRVDGPVIAQIRRSLSVYRSAYYQRGWTAQLGHREVAIFSISGWTDDLFPAVESFRMFQYLKRLDPLWPVAVAVADVGHSRAQNKPAVWRRLDAQAFQFLSAQIAGSHREQTTVSSEPTLCGAASDSTAAERLTAATPQALAHGTLSVQFRRGGRLTSTGGLLDPNGPATDALLPGPPCRTDRGPALGGYTAYSQPLPRRATYVGIGFVQMRYVLTPGRTATLAARLWDAPPAGRALLVSRGVYRFDLPGYDTLVGMIRLPLYGNHWIFPPGHRIRIDLTQADVPTYRPANPFVSSDITFAPPTLVLPVREASSAAISSM